MEMRRINFDNREFSNFEMKDDIVFVTDTCHIDGNIVFHNTTPVSGTGRVVIPSRYNIEFEDTSGFMKKAQCNVGVGRIDTPDGIRQQYSSMGFSPRFSKT